MRRNSSRGRRRRRRRKRRRRSRRSKRYVYTVRKVALSLATTR